MKQAIFSVLVILVGVAVYGGQSAAQSDKDKKRDDLKSDNVEILQLKSKVFDNTRSIRVLLPPGYYEAKNKIKSYPVFYLNDGIMVFRPKGLDIEGVAYEHIKKGIIPPMIVVGIDNGACTDKTKNELTDRANEFLPYPDIGFAPDHTYAPEPPNPQGRLYPRFLIDEVMPFINERYRTLTGPTNTGLGGSSYGGVAALYTAIKNPGVFGKLMLESTPLWIGGENQLLNDATSAKQWPQTIYLGSGTAETDDQAFLIEGDKDRTILSSAIKKASPSTNLKTVLEPGGKHEPAAWRRRLPEAHRLLWGR
jgi:predicted alpha/beta superfamily hydrolase